MVSMGTVWDRAIEFISDNLSVIVPIALLAIFLPSSIQTNIAPLADQSPSAKLLVNLAALVLSLVSLWGQLAIVALALDPAAGRAPALGTANRRLLPLVGVTLLVLVGALLLVLPIPLVLGVTGYDLQAAMAGQRPQMAPGAVGFVTLYLIVLVPLCLFFAARLALVTPVVAAERRGLGALARSFALTRGLTWKIIGVLVLFGIVASVAVLAAKTVFGSILELIAGGEGDITVATVLTSVIVGAVSTGFTVIAAAFVAKLYVAARGAPGAAVYEGSAPAA